MTVAHEKPVARSLSSAEIGVLLAIGAHLVWGGMAVYFGHIRYISPMEIAVNRGVWALPIAAAVVWYMGQWRDVWRAVKNPRHLAILALTAGLIVFNWGFYVWSIQAGRTLESSLGYFINPLLNVVMGYLFLGERFTMPQKVALALATVAVLIQTWALGHVPWLGLMLASTFCLYGFLRKTIPVGPTQGVSGTLAPGQSLFDLRALGRTRTLVLINGQRFAVVGNISMDNLTVDLGADEGGVEIGDRVTLLGVDRSERVLSEELAQRVGTINYEIVTSVSARVPRQYSAVGGPAQ